MYLDMGLETLDSKFRELRVRELTARLSPPSGKPIPVVLGEGGGSQSQSQKMIYWMSI